MPARIAGPSPWWLRWIALVYAVFVLGVYTYVLVWELVTDPVGTSFWAEPLHLVSQPLSTVLVAMVSGDAGVVLGVIAGPLQALLVFLLCRWFDRGFGNHHAARPAD